MPNRSRGFEAIGGYEGILLPERKTMASAGYDLAAVVDVILEAGQVTLVPTGLKAYMQMDEYLAIHIRSSMAVKHSLSLINGQGIIDADYYNNADNEGHLLIAVYNHSKQALPLEKGTRIAQGIFVKYLITDTDSAIATRTGGMGSTGKR